MSEKGTRWIRRAMGLILAGLVVELISLLWLHHPLGFMLFAALGGTFIVVGSLIAVYCVVVLIRPPGSESAE
ncbi:MAG: hypothetical protein ACR2QM_06915 [Longimicrobiales bacterium]